ncbi:MAG: hypothetical protein JWM10_3211 [Myxococcaceae bacterium]|nr:hypothetical protein [Myxococcaceae bacterium]
MESPDRGPEHPLRGLARGPAAGADLSAARPVEGLAHHGLLRQHGRRRAQPRPAVARDDHGPEVLGLVREEGLGHRHELLIDAAALHERAGGDLVPDRNVLHRYEAGEQGAGRATSGAFEATFTGSRGARPPTPDGTRRRRRLGRAASKGRSNWTSAALAGGADDAVDAPLVDEPAVPVPGGMAAVGVVGCDDVAAAVERAVALLGGINEIRPGPTVFIKPDAVDPMSASAGSPAVTTSIAALQAVIRLVRRSRPAKIIVGDRSAGIFQSNFVFRPTGMREAALAAGADEVYEAPRPNQDEAAWRMVQPPGWEETWRAQGGILAMRKILEADHFIDLPVCKNHRWAVISLSMKNLIGAIGDESRDPIHDAEGDADRISRDIAILNGAFRPLISIVDARAALINGGPEGSGTDRVTVSPGLIFASRDRVAVDAAAASMMKFELGRTAAPMPDPLHALLTSTCVGPAADRARRRVRPRRGQRRPRGASRGPASPPRSRRSSRRRAGGGPYCSP